MAAGPVPGLNTNLADVITGYGRQKGEAATAQAQPGLIAAQTSRENALTQGQQIENQLKQAQIRDQEIQRQLITEGGMSGTGGTSPSYLTDPRAYYNEAIRRGMTLGGATAGATQLFNLQQNALKLGPDQQAAENALHQGIKGSLEGYLNNPTAENYGAFYNEVANREPSLLSTIPKPLPGVTPRQQELAYAIGHIGMVGDLLAKAKTQAETGELTAKTGQATAEAEKAGAETKKIGTEQELTQHKIDLYNTLKNSPEALSQRVAQSIDPQKYPDEYNRALAEAQSQPDLEGINKAIERHSQNVSEREKTIAVESSPEVMKARQNQAIAIEQATNPLKLEQARAVAGATAGQREALKLDQDYVKSASATEALGRVLDETGAGNKAAGAALPTVSAVTFNHINDLKRLNRNEITGLGGEEAGNLFDRVEGFFQKAVVGTTKIPENIQDDIRKLHQNLAENAYKQYTTGLDALSKRTGTPYQPTVAAPNIRKAGAGAAQGGYEIGVSYGGLKYLGGDPKQESSWQKK